MKRPSSRLGWALAGLCLVLLGFCVWLPPAAWAAVNPNGETQTVRVRAGDHPSYSRLVFDWPEAPGFDLVRDGTSLVIAFDRDAGADLANVRRRQPRNIAGLEADRADGRLTLRAAIPATGSVKSFRIGPKVVIDVGDAGTDSTPTRAVADVTTDRSRSARAAPAPEPAPTRGSAEADSAAARRTAAVGEGVTPEAVGVRAGLHPNKNRLVFDFRDPVSVETDRDAGSLMLEFSKPAAFDLGRVNPERLPNVGAIAQQATLPAARVALQVPPESRVTTFKVGPKVVVDISDPPPGSPPASAALADDGRDQGGRADPARMAPRERARPIPALGTAGSGRVQPAVATRVEPMAADERDLSSMGGDADADAKTGGPTRTEPIRQLPDDVRARVLFPVGELGAVAYVRGGTAMVVFDGPLSRDAVRVEAADSGAVPTIEPQSVRGGSGFVLRLPGLLEAGFERVSDGWQLSLRRKAKPPSTAVPIRAEPEFALGGRVVVESGAESRILEMVDPVVGDQLYLVPMDTVGGVVAARDLSGFVLLPTLQGVAVRLRSDAVVARAVTEGVEITEPGGLAMSPSSDRERAIPLGSAAMGESAELSVPSLLEQRREPSLREPMLKFVQWQRGSVEDFTKRRQELEKGVVDAPTQSKVAARLALAQFYAGHGFFQEALGVLAVVEQEEPDLANWPAYKALKGTAQIGALRYPEGLALLDQPGVRNHPEADLWRARAAAEQRHWPQAVDGLVRNLDRIDNYPEPHRSWFFKLAIEAFLETGEVDAAREAFRRWLDQADDTLMESAPARYFKGRLAMLQDEPDLETAREDLEAAAESWDRLYRAEARMALINLGLQENQLTPGQAVEQLADLRFAWRGDLLELDVIERKGEVEWLAGDYADSLLTLREAASLYPDGERAQEITATMARNFTALFADGAKSLPPLKALGLYNQFRELTPVGAEGDQVIRQLAERLVEVDLLDKAAELLTYQVDYRLDGLERARVGARLASINLLDGEAKAALDALDRSKMASPPVELDAERRRLRARAYAKLERPYEALQQIADDDSRPADLLRVDIAWANRDWGLAASVLARLVPPPPPDGTLSEDDTRMVINRAIALGLAGNDAALQDLKQAYGAAMAGTDQNGLFQVLTRQDPVERRLSRELIEARVSEVDAFNTVLEGYQARASAVAPGTG